MALSDIINISVVVQIAKTLGSGFGIPMILSESGTPTWTGQVRSYTSPAGVASDYSTSSAEYRAASAMFAQSPQPPIVKIGVGVNLPTQHWTVTPAYANNTTYAMTVVDTAGVSHAISVTTGSTNLSTLIGQLKTAIDALSLALTTVNTGTTLTIAANSAGAFFGISVASISLLAIVHDMVDPGVAADLTTLAAADPAWYALCTTFNSKAIVLAAAAWVESNKKLYVAGTMDSTVPSTSPSGATDVAASAKASAYTRTAILYHGANYEFADAAWEGACLPLVSGSETWAFKTLAGVTAESTLCANWSETFRNNIVNITGKNANEYDVLGSVNITQMGTVASGQFIDVTRFIDWSNNDIATRVFNVLTQPNKDPYTDDGITAIQSAILASLKQGIVVGGIAKTPAPTCSVPTALSVDATDRQNRNLPGVTFSYRLAGAIHTTQINGVVTS